MSNAPYDIYPNVLQAKMKYDYIQLSILWHVIDDAASSGNSVGFKVYMAYSDMENKNIEKILLNHSSNVPSFDDSDISWDDDSYILRILAPDLTEYSIDGQKVEFICETFDAADNYYGTTSCSVTLTSPDPVKIAKEYEVIVGKESYIKVSYFAKNYRCNVFFEYGNDRIQICSNLYGQWTPDIKPGFTFGDFYWEPDSKIAKMFGNLRSVTAKFVCETYNYSKKIGSTETYFTLTVPDNDSTKPAIESVKLINITDLDGELSTIYIQGRTGLNVQISAKSDYSDIKDYEVTAGSVSAKGNPAIIDAIVNNGNIPVTVKVTDARGFSRTVTENIYVYPYSRPKIVPYTGYSDIVCERAKATGELHSDGTYLAIMAGKRFTSIVKDGAELNSCRLRYRFKPTTVDTFGDWVTLLADGSAETAIQLLAGNVVSSTNASYDIELAAIDLVGSEHVIRFSVMTSAISFVLYDGVDGAAFGKYPEEPHVVDIAQHMTLRVRGRLEVLGSNWESLDLADGMNESPYAYGRQDDTGCYYQVSNGNHVQAAFNCAYDYAGRSMVVNKTPIPEEYRPERTVCSICPTNDRRLALVTVQPDGYIRIEWVQTIASTSNTTSATVLWVDGYLDYWV